MKKNLPVSFAVLICLMIVAGCTGHNKIAAQKKLAAMSDRDLVEHYKTVEMRLEDLDRAKAQSMEENERISKRDGGPDYLSQMHHLHIGDTWYGLRKEKDLTLRELRKRGLSPP